MSDPFSTPQLHDPSQPPPAPGTTTEPAPDLAPQRAQDQGTPRNGFNSERPLGVAPVPEGSVAIGGQANLPESRPSIGDKIIGKTQKVIGKYTQNPDLHEKGGLRETGGKAATESRAAYD